MRKRIQQLLDFVTRRRRTILIWGGILVVNAVTFLVLGYYLFVIKYPGEHLARENILAALTQETAVYYRDGKTRLGAFFDQSHREYVRYEDIPELLVNALVAAEDQRFFDHGGVDPRGIARAMLANLAAMRLVQGGSTLTQQTAKNVFGRKSRSLLPKLRELLNALRLEAHYTKQDILEFYLNQFWVNGNGRGAAIAARYFFDKPLENIDLVEAAFIAGSVKGPMNYTPFTKDTPEAEARALERANLRKNYVIGNMFELGMITAEQKALAQLAPVPFRQGKFRFVSNAVIDAVAAELEGEFAPLLEEVGVANLATAGLSIVTTLDPVAQAASLYALRHELSVLQTKLSGYENATGEPQKPDVLREGSFYRGVISAVSEAADGKRLLVDLGRRGGVIDERGLAPQADALARHRSWRRKANSDDSAKLLEKLTVGATVLVSVRANSPEQEYALLTLEHEPEVNGGLLVLEDGAVRGMAAGFTNADFNRALQARRQPGSSFKPLVFLAALQLGYSPDSSLYNAPTAFHHQSTVYFPSPDHDPPAPEVSISNAGVSSENIASVWLLYHLTQRLGAADFGRLLEHLGMSKRYGEERKDYIARLQNDYGVLDTDDGLRELAYINARDQVLGELERERGEWRGDREMSALLGLSYGRGFAAERERLRKDRKDKQRRRKMAVLHANFLNYQTLAAQLQAKLDRLADAGGEAYSDPESEPAATTLRAALRGFYYASAVSGTDAPLAFGEPDADTHQKWKPLTEALYRRMLDEGAGLMDDIFGGDIEVIEPDDLRLDGIFRKATIERVAERLKESLEASGLLSAERFSRERLLHSQEMRVEAGLRYVVRLAHSLGVKTELDPVLSFPLGVNSITLAELASVYQAFFTSAVFAPGEELDYGRPRMIERIVNRAGEVIYQTEPVSRLTGNPNDHRAVAHILRRVVKSGTGRSLRDLPLGPGGNAASIRVPAFGKTGTTNGFTNATFAGFLPYPPLPLDGIKPEAFDPRHGYTIVTYVGYDDNKPLVSKGNRFKASGSSGAVPVWRTAARGIIMGNRYDAMVDYTGMASTDYPLDWPSGLAFAPVAPPGGLPLDLPLEGADRGPDYVAVKGAAGDSMPRTGVHLFTLLPEQELEAASLTARAAAEKILREAPPQALDPPPELPVYDPPDVPAQPEPEAPGEPPATEADPEPRPEDSDEEEPAPAPDSPDEFDYDSIDDFLPPPNDDGDDENEGE